MPTKTVVLISMCYLPPAAKVLDLQWNPSPDYAPVLIVVLSTGAVNVLEVKDDVSVLVKRENLLANCGKLGGVFSIII